MSKREGGSRREAGARLRARSHKKIGPTAPKSTSWIWP
jgi:hypothetical protein